MQDFFIFVACLTIRKKKRMKKLSVLFLIILTIQIYFPQDDPAMKNINELIEEVRLEYAPDKRVALFDVVVEKSGENYILKGETNLPETHDFLIKELNKMNVKLDDQIEQLPEEELGDKIYGVVNLSVANLRSKPGHSQELSTQSLLGTPIKVYKKEGGFYYVQTPDGYLAWMDDDGFAPMSKAEQDEWLKAKKVIFLQEYGHSYSEIDKRSQHVSDLVSGNILKFVSEERDFYKVEYPDGRQAYVSKNSSMIYDDWLKSIDPTAENVIKEAKKFMGVPYLWGGTSSKGMDCSGFTKTAFFLNGIILPRDASQQVNTGELVNTENGFENWKPGDLLFFGRKASDDKPERITHVAIYLGDMDFIHASGRVRHDSFDKTKPNYNEYRLNTFIRAKRILTSIDENGITTVTSNKFYSGE